jgi:hypothetical protein
MFADMFVSGHTNRTFSLSFMMPVVDSCFSGTTKSFWWNSLVFYDSTLFKMQQRLKKDNKKNIYYPLNLLLAC